MSSEVKLRIADRHTRSLGSNRSVAAFVLLGALLGCGPKSDLSPVSGIVTVDGKPVAAAQVLFSAASGRPAAGETDAQGRYVLSTHETGDGAAVGTYSVTVTARPTIRVSAAGAVGPPTGRPKVEHGAVSPVPMKYSDITNPQLTVEVRPGDNDIPLELKN